MEINRLFEFLDFQLANSPQSTCLATKKKSGWERFSTAEVKEIVDELSLGLLALGVEPGDKVAIASTTNRAEWNFVDLACLQLGVVDVPVYPTISEKDYNFIFNQAEVKYCFVSDKALYDKMKNVQSELTNLKEVFIFDDEPGCQNWKEVREKGKSGDKASLEACRSAVKYEDLATIIYTSGTTGEPKGVMLAHSNLISNALASSERLPIDPGTKSVSFLPLCHSFERMLIYLYMYKGVQVHYAESMETIGDDLRDVKPEIFTAVPRLLEKVYDKIMAKGEDLTGIKRKLFFWAVGLAEKFEYQNKNGAWYGFKLKIARKVIFSKWQEALGGNVKLAASGSAALSERLNRIFNGAGIPVMEGYGLTETSPVISVNELNNDGFKFGTTGRPISGVEVKIAEDGEILCKGPNVMMGYYKNKEKTEEVIKNGWFHTGDIGVLEDGQYVKITDRKKEIFKTSGGKYIAPQPMENIFKQSPFIEQIIIIGENQKHSSALVVPNFEHLKSYCEKNKIEFSSNIEVVKNKRVEMKIIGEIEYYNKQFGKWEQVKKPKLLSKEFTIEGGELTPTLKLKRKVILAKYEKEISDIYC